MKDPQSQAYYLERKVAELNEQGHWILKSIAKLDEKTENLSKKLDRLIAFKWQIIGGSAVLSLLGVLSLELIKLKMTHS